MFVVWAFFYIYSTLLSYALRQTPKNPAKRGSLQDFNFPTIDQGWIPPDIHGTCKLESPIVAAVFDYQTAELRHENVPVGYRYYLGLHLMWCTGPDVELVEFWFDDKKRPFQVQENYGFQRVTVNLHGAREMPGTPTVEEGELFFYPGSQTQPSNGTLALGVQAGPNGVPAYRGICHTVLRNFYVGDSPTAKKISIVARKFGNALGLTPGHERIGNDRNPACMLYDIATLPKVPYGGGGLVPDELDLIALRAVGETLYAEQFGLSMLFQGQSPDEKILQILQHLDAVRYVDPQTGKLVFKLIRDDYDPAEIPTFGPGSLREFERKYSDLTLIENAVNVRYIDAEAGFIPGIAPIQNDAAVDAAGGDVHTLDITLNGISNSTTARMVGARILQGISRVPIPVSGAANRSAASLRPGSVIKVDWPNDGFQGLIIRITNVGLPSIRGTEVRFDGIEDVFGTDWVTYAEPPPSGWLPIQPAAALGSQLLIEAPRALAGYVIQDDASVPTGLALAARGNGAQTGFNVLILDGATYRESLESGAFSPRADLLDDITPTAKYMRVQGVQGMDRLSSISGADLDAGRNVLLIDGELIAFGRVQDNGNGTYTLADLYRGCVDTVPASHVAGADLWFPSHGAALVPLNAFGELQATQQTTVKLQPFNSAGDLDPLLCSASTVAVTAPPRAKRPGAPARVLVKNASYPASITGELSLSWKHRNRLESAPYRQQNATAEAESGTTYTVEIYGEAGTLKHTEAGLASTSWAYPSATEISESGLGRLNHSLRIRIWSVRSGVTSWQVFDWTVTRP